MPLYEHVFISRQDLSNAQAEGLIEHFSTVLSDNGGKLHRAVAALARAQGDADLAEWILAEAAFPNSMVDRIVPATTDGSPNEGHTSGSRSIDDGGAAVRIAIGCGPFVAARDTSDEAQRDLARLVAEHGPCAPIEPEPWPAPPGCHVAELLELVQMVADNGILPGPVVAGIAALAGASALAHSGLPLQALALLGAAILFAFAVSAIARTASTISVRPP